jgi:hypothetical protein
VQGTDPEYAGEISERVRKMPDEERKQHPELPLSESI